MDIICKGVLNFIQTQKGHENSVLAGGAIRDSVLGLEPKDFDLFIPSRDKKQIKKLMEDIGREFPVTDELGKHKDYKELALRQQKMGAQGITNVIEFYVEGKRFDLIGINEENDEDFGHSVINNFDYGLNMAYHDGTTLEDSNKYFSEDTKYGQATLVNMLGLYELPSAMARYNKMNEKYKKLYGRDLEFVSVCLSYTPGLDKIKAPKYKTKLTEPSWGLAQGNQGPEPAPAPQFIPTTGGIGNSLAGVAAQWAPQTTEWVQQFNAPPTAQAQPVTPTEIHETMDNILNANF